MKVICRQEEILVEEIVKEYTTMLYRLAMIRCNNQEDAEEVVQDVFLRLIAQIRKGKVFEDREHVRAWLLKVAVNRGKTLVTLPWNTRTVGMDAAMQFPAGERTEHYAYEYVLRLPEKHRVAINLFYYEQLSTEQIAAIMKTKPATVRSYLHRGREKLKTMMEADGYVG